MPFDFFKYDFKLNVGLQYPFVFDYKGINATLGRTIIDVVLSGVSPLVLENAIQLNYLKVFGGTGQRNLPEGYTEYDGLVGDGTAYIDLNCTLDQNDEIEVEFTIPATLPNSRSIFGFRNNASSRNIAVMIGGTGSLVVDWNNSDYTTYRFTATPTASTRYKAVLNKTGRYLYQGSTLVDSNTTACNDTITTGNVRLFYLGGSPAYTGSNSKFNGAIHRCTVKGKLDLIPAGNGTAYGMYDKVNQVFYQNSTEALEGSAFTVGNAVVPTPDTPMDIVSNNGVLKAKHQSGLPLGYTLLEYIESDGTQYIDTGINQTTLVKPRIITKYKINVGEDKDWFGGSNDGGGGGIIWNIAPKTTRIAYIRWKTQASRVITYESGYSVSDLVFLSDFHTLDVGGVEESGVVPIMVDNNLIANMDSTTTLAWVNHNLLIFRSGRSGQNGACSFSYFTIYSNDVKVWDGVACRRNSDNVLGMYDLVSGQFFTNAGTGTFTAGNLVSDPVEIYTDGTVETIALNGGTATAEMLLKVGNYQDVQSILDGEVTRQIGIKVLDGTEDWTKSGNLFYADIASDALQDTHGCYCTHFQGIATNGSANYQNEIKVGTNSTANIRWERVQVYPVVDTFADATAFKTWLADQYAAGTPVIIIYPLATATTESVTGQTLTASGNCIAEITQASMSGLEMELSYKQEQ